MVTDIKDLGEMINIMAKGFFITRQGDVTKETGKIISIMALAGFTVVTET